MIKCSLYILSGCFNISPLENYLVDIGVPEAAVKNKMGANQKSPIDEEKESITFDTEEGQDVKSYAHELLKDTEFGNEIISKT